jgi:c-di-GMP-binding flagellar brake protein YcgR
MAETSKSERRRNKRISFIKDVEVIGVGIRRSSDLSIGGMYIETVTTFPVGAILDLRFKLQEIDDQLIQVQAKVLYEHGGIGIGLCFVDLSPEDREKIQKLVDQN